MRVLIFLFSIKKFKKHALFLTFSHFRQFYLKFNLPLTVLCIFYTSYALKITKLLTYKILDGRGAANRCHKNWNKSETVKKRFLMGLMVDAWKFETYHVVAYSKIYNRVFSSNFREPSENLGFHQKISTRNLGFKEIHKQGKILSKKTSKVMNYVINVFIIFLFIT